MTTLAYKNGILAVDSQGTRGDQIETYHEIKLRIRGQRVVALCGEYGRIFPIALDLLENGTTTLRIPDKAGAIVFWSPEIPKQFVIHECDGFFYQPIRQMFALGSGRAVAMGAMAAGRGAVDAVKIACKYDVYTGGRVHACPIPVPLLASRPVKLRKARHDKRA